MPDPCIPPTSTDAPVTSAQSTTHDAAETSWWQQHYDLMSYTLTQDAQVRFDSYKHQKYVLLITWYFSCHLHYSCWYIKLIPKYSIIYRYFIAVQYILHISQNIILFLVISLWQNLESKSNFILYIHIIVCKALSSSIVSKIIDIPLVIEGCTNLYNINQVAA